MSTMHTVRHAATPKIKSRTAIQDASGYAIFSTGSAGSAHAMAHRMLDEGKIELGYFLLGAWIEGRNGSSSECIHIQFHMAVFELELGLWDAAFARFTTRILPAAAHTTDALTDAPALAWRLWLAAGEPRFFPWEPMRRRAAVRIDLHEDLWTDLHNALALTGAGDLDNLDRWLNVRTLGARTPEDRVVLEVATALRAFVTGDYLQAATDLAEAVPAVPSIGGSRAQNQLFQQIEAAAWRHATSWRTSSTTPMAA